MMSMTVNVKENEFGDVVYDATGEPFGPQSAMLGTWDPVNGPQHKMWMDDITENPAVGATEVWEIRNFTADAHPIHIHLVQFQVVNREVTDDTVSPRGPNGTIIPRETWETGFKDTVIVYPGELTGSRPGSTPPGSSCGTATSSSTRTTR